VLSGEGLYVAAACVRGLAGAPAAFEAAQFPGLHRALAKLNEGQTFADEALQHLPVLMTGSTFTSEEITEAGRLGAFAWSNRSFETEPFLFTIRRELARLGVNP
jgi:hypothetical protein